MTDPLTSTDPGHDTDRPTEAELYRFGLEAIADGCPHPASFAQLALKLGEELYPDPATRLRQSMDSARL